VKRAWATIVAESAGKFPLAMLVEYAREVVRQPNPPQSEAALATAIRAKFPRADNALILQAAREVFEEGAQDPTYRAAIAHAERMIRAARHSGDAFWSTERELVADIERTFGLTFRLANAAVAEAFALFVSDDLAGLALAAARQVKTKGVDAVAANAGAIATFLAFIFRVAYADALRIVQEEVAKARGGKDEISRAEDLFFDGWAMFQVIGMLSKEFGISDHKANAFATEAVNFLRDRHLLDDRAELKAYLRRANAHGHPLPSAAMMAAQYFGADMKTAMVVAQELLAEAAPPLPAEAVEQARAIRQRVADLADERDARLSELRAEKAGLAEQLEILRRDRNNAATGLGPPLTAEEVAALARLELQSADVAQELSRTHDLFGRRAMDLISVEAEGTTVAVRLPEGATPALARAVEEGLADLRRLVPADKLSGVTIDMRYIPPTAEQRAFFDVTGKFIGTSQHMPPRTFVHEMGHAIETRHPDLLQQSLAFVARRTAGESARLLRDLMNDPRYELLEVARPDKFISPYIGKEYVGASEVLSMGLEMLATDPIGFAELDADMFEFIVALLRRAVEGPTEAFPKLRPRP
jgi:hypothetical protein